MASCKYEERETSEFFDTPQRYTVIQNNAEFVTTRDIYIYIYKAGWCSEVLSKEMLMAKSDLGFRTKVILHTKCGYSLNSNFALMKKKGAYNCMHQWCAMVS